MGSIAIGIDVSKATLDVCVLAGVGAKPRHHKFKNCEDGFKKMVDWVSALGPDMPRHFCLEATGSYGFGVASHLADGGHKVSVENPRPVKHLAIALGLKVKTDKVDAFCIARYVQVRNPRGESLPSCTPASGNSTSSGWRNARASRIGFFRDRSKAKSGHTSSILRG